ncbi:MAG: UbiX family flavin prenyltransferase [Methanomassiliicoccus sp.]|nr:UbiX family flavin prenyltransferase [Methanomassiliicoccus sp.]
MRYVVAITGCSGVRYGVRLLEELEGDKELVVSDMGRRVLEHETDISSDDLNALADDVYDDHDLFAPPASGTHVIDAMIVCPCSQSTMAKLAAGVSDSLLTRAASVCLKEHRKLILVPRETPLNTIMLENELRLARAGAIILPASPAFYQEPRSVEMLIDFVIGKILDQLGQEHDLFKRWE